MIFSFEEKKKNGETLFGSLENGLWWKDKQVFFFISFSFFLKKRN